MNPRILGQMADQHSAEMRASATWVARSSTAGHTADHTAETPAVVTRHPIRRRTGWALVSVGLWLASADR
jgi:hypothetical protein